LLEDRGARRTLRTAHPITSSLSDAASNTASLPALRSTEAAFCRLRAPRSLLFGFFFLVRFASQCFQQRCLALLFFLCGPANGGLFLIQRRSGMRRRVDLLQLADGHLRVNFRAVQISAPQHLLDEPDSGTRKVSVRLE